MKKVGRFFYSLTPGVAFLALQLIVGIGVAIVYQLIIGIQLGLQNPGMSSTELTQLIIDQSAEMLGNISTVSVFFVHIFGIILFSIWYYFGCGRPKKAPVSIIFKGKFIITSIIAAIIFVINNFIVLYILSLIAPKVVENYLLMSEQALGGNVWLSLIAVVILAPIGEEIAFRGLTLHIARKFTNKFWIANTIQAFMFGFVHFNLVQGIYAFLGGLMLGWLYKKYNSLYIVMFIHFLVNLSASFLGTSISDMMEKYDWFGLVLIGVAVSLLVALIQINKDKESKIEEI